MKPRCLTGQTQHLLDGANAKSAVISLPRVWAFSEVQHFGSEHTSNACSACCTLLARQIYKITGYWVVNRVTTKMGLFKFTFICLHFHETLFQITSATTPVTCHCSCIKLTSMHQREYLVSLGVVLSLGGTLRSKQEKNLWHCKTDEPVNFSRTFNFLRLGIKQFSNTKMKPTIVSVCLFENALLLFILKMVSRYYLVAFDKLLYHGAGDLCRCWQHSLHHGPHGLHQGVI